MNNTHFSCEGPLICRFFSTKLGSKIQHCRMCKLHMWTANFSCKWIPQGPLQDISLLRFGYAWGPGPTSVAYWEITVYKKHCKLLCYKRKSILAKDWVYSLLSFVYYFNRLMNVIIEYLIMRLILLILTCTKRQVLWTEAGFKNQTVKSFQVCLPMPSLATKDILDKKHHILKDFTIAPSLGSGAKEPNRYYQDTLSVYAFCARPCAHTTETEVNRLFIS